MNTTTSEAGGCVHYAARESLCFLRGSSPLSDLVGQFIPDSSPSASAEQNPGELPKISDIIMHPPSVHKALTGEYDDDKTEDDVLEKLIEIAVGRLAVKEDQHGQQIRYVDTPLIEAIRYGYLCELQEPSCIANPGVLVGLNSEEELQQIYAELEYQMTRLKERFSGKRVFSLSSSEEK